MNIKILEEKENSLLNRKEITAEIDSPDKTPTNKEFKKELASKLNVKEDLIVIKSIHQIYGKKNSKAQVNIYKDEKSLKQIEPQPKEKKVKEEKPAEAPKPEEKPAEAKPEQVPAEQKKPEEKKEEVKKKE